MEAATYESLMSQVLPPAAETPLIELLLPLIGVLLGALVAAAVGVWTVRQQRKAQVAMEQRAREALLQDKRREMSMAASARAGEALAELLLLPEIHIRQSEYRTRYLAVADGLGCLGAFRRDESLPQPTEDFLTTMEYVDLHLETLELNSGR